MIRTDLPVIVCDFHGCGVRAIKEAALGFISVKEGQGQQRDFCSFGHFSQWLANYEAGMADWLERLQRVAVARSAVIGPGGPDIIDIGPMGPEGELTDARRPAWYRTEYFRTPDSTPPGGGRE